MNAFSSVGDSISNAITNLVSRMTHSTKHDSQSDYRKIPRYKNPNRYSANHSTSESFLRNSFSQTLERPSSTKRPYMVFVYSQKIHVEGQGLYELKITNLINPYTMKATPLQPSLVNPVYMMAQGIGNNKKAISLTQQQV